jgi:SAM-dependent methyltransferase
MRRALSRLGRAVKRPFKRLEERFFPGRIFTRIYEKGRWRSGGTPSGAGSTIEQTTEVRSQLPALLGRYGVRTVLDIPCGDFNWMKELAYPLDVYIGGDIVRSLIDRNRTAYASPKRHFEHLNLIGDSLPAVDLILCRDCWVHLANTQVLQAIENVRRSGATYLLATTYPRHTANTDIRAGNWRPVNLQAAPFNLPPPLEFLFETPQAVDHRWGDKSLGLWALADLP